MSDQRPTRIERAREQAERLLSEMDDEVVHRLQIRVEIDAGVVNVYREHLSAAFKAKVLTLAETAYCAEALTDWGWAPSADLAARWAVSQTVYELMKAARP